MFEIIITTILCACIVAATAALCTFVYKMFKDGDSK